MEKNTNATLTGALEEALDLVQNNWSQNALARDINGNKVAPQDDRAVSFSFMGATMHIASRHPEIFPLADKAFRTIFETDDPETSFDLGTKDGAVAQLRRMVDIARTCE